MWVLIAGFVVGIVDVVVGCSAAVKLRLIVDEVRDLIE